MTAGSIIEQARSMGMELDPEHSVEYAIVILAAKLLGAPDCDCRWPNTIEEETLRQALVRLMADYLGEVGSVIFQPSDGSLSIVISANTDIVREYGAFIELFPGGCLSLNALQWITTRALENMESCWKQAQALLKEPRRVLPGSCPDEELYGFAYFEADEGGIGFCGDPKYWQEVLSSFAAKP